MCFHWDSFKQQPNKKNIIEKTLSAVESVSTGQRLSNLKYGFLKYSQTCVQRPPLGPEKRGDYAKGYMKKISG